MGSGLEHMRAYSNKVSLRETYADLQKRIQDTPPRAPLLATNPRIHKRRLSLMLTWPPPKFHEPRDILVKYHRSYLTEATSARELVLLDSNSCISSLPPLFLLTTSTPLGISAGRFRLFRVIIFAASAPCSARGPGDSFSWRTRRPGDVWSRRSIRTPQPRSAGLRFAPVRSGKVARVPTDMTDV